VAALRAAAFLLRCTLAERFDRKKTDRHVLVSFIPNPEAPSKSPSRKTFQAAGNKPARGTVLNMAASVAFKPFQREDQPMTISTRIALGLSAAVVSLSLALAPAAFAQDKMGKDDGMKKDTMSKDKMGKDDGMKKDTMSKDTMSKDGMKKDDGMKKN
jgi:pentapeptide MXKDX repeat protein